MGHNNGNTAIKIIYSMRVKDFFFTTLATTLLTYQWPKSLARHNQFTNNQEKQTDCSQQWL